MKINCIAIDDEPLALGLISNFIKQTPFLNLVATYSSAVKAIESIKQEQIQLIFLDIQMPNLNGLELAKLLHNTNQPEQPKIIFTTAYNQFAVESYRVDALDYLLKPFAYEDFLRAANKALAYYEQKSAPVQSAAQDGFIFVRVEYQLVRIALDDILFIEGLKDYVKIHLASSQKAVLSLMTMKSVEEKLNPQRFMRIQRSFIIALDKISAVTRTSVWIGDTEISIGEQYKPALQEFIGKWF